MDRLDSTTEARPVDVQDPATTEAVNRATMMRFWEATESGNLESAAELVHPDITMEWPQSGERFSGLDNALGALRATEVKPDMAGEPSLEGCGDLWVARAPLRYGDDIYHYVGIFRVEDGKIRRTTEFFGAPFPPNPGRAQFSDPR
jgi:ketosteroid isomerase-like protein